EAGNIYARSYADPTVYKMTSPGVFVPFVTLTGGPLDIQSAVVFNGALNGFVAMNGGVVTQWDLAGNFLSTTNLAGGGAVAGEGNYPQDRGIAVIGNRWLTYSNQTLSMWDLAGNRLGTTTLLGAGTSFDSHFSFSYANGRAFVVDNAGGMWRGYDVGLGGAG